MHVSTTNSNPGTKPWEDRIAIAAQEAMRGNPFCSEGPVIVHCTFAMPRIKELEKKKNQGKIFYPVQKKRNDVDKLLRAVLDGLTGVVFDDDAQVVNCFVAKYYAEPGRPPGVYISVSDQLLRLEGGPL